MKQRKEEKNQKRRKRERRKVEGRERKVSGDVGGKSINREGKRKYEKAVKKKS